MNNAHSPCASEKQARSSSKPRRTRKPPRRWLVVEPRYPQGPPRTPQEQVQLTLDAPKLLARSLVAADDMLVLLFDNSRVRLYIRTVGRRDISRLDTMLLKTNFDMAFKAGVVHPGQANTFTKLMQSYGLVARDADAEAAFSNLSQRYAGLKYSPRVKVSNTTMNGRVEACIIATSPIPSGTFVLELGGLMSADAIEKLGGSHPVSKYAIQPRFEMFSVIWRGKGQCGPGPKADRLLLGPARFVNHSCNPNCRLRPVAGTNAWGVEATKEISPDEELTVNYGDYYFAPGECACAPCQIDITETLDTSHAPSLAAQPAFSVCFGDDQPKKRKRPPGMDADKNIGTPRNKRRR